MTAPAKPALTMCRDVPVPSAADLSWEQYGGRACFACGKPLTVGAVSCGRARGRQGVHVLDVEVWACP
ncbi:hypothetical protein [Streptomyces sp. NPDC020681]|uniref:hypothetical protein n=1 Tax=Streptomyces sp. NPDC020681 TaxID=3365083 RepID=UPI0037971719